MTVIRRAARALLYPVHRILDPRFHDVAHRITLLRGEVGTVGVGVTDLAPRVELAVEASLESSAAQVETMAILGQELRGATGEVAAVNTSVSGIESQLGMLRTEIMQLSANEHEASYRARMAATIADGRLETLDLPAADLINFALSHRGFAAQAGLWLNPPVTVHHAEGRAELGVINERIVEIPFAMRALGQVPLGSRILDFGSSESTVSLSLASLGYEVTALDLSRYPFTHPNLDVVQAPLEDTTGDTAGYDAALLISTVEHVGLGWYGEQPGRFDDHAAMQRIAELMKPGGLIVVTVPYGKAGVDEVQRVYDAPGLDALLAGLEIVDRVIAEQRDGAWVVVDDSTADAVAMVTARVPAS